MSDPVQQLSHFLAIANETSAETIKKLPEAFKFLADVDDLFVRYLSEGGKVSPPTTAILLLSAHATFRAAIGLSLSGQLLPVFMALRGCIEAALYANAIAMDPALSDVWFARGCDEEARKACRNAFAINKMFAKLSEAHDEEFSASVKDVYEASIDFGAHPNMRSIIGSLEIEELKSGAHHLEYVYIHGSHATEMQRSLIACAETGIRVLFIALIAYSEHPLVVDLNERGLALQNEIPKFAESLGFRHGVPDAPSVGAP